MVSVGIIANPASGKDIRRLVAKAWVVSNQKKANIVGSVLAGLHSTGVQKIYIMPDSFGIGTQAIHSLKGQIPDLSNRVELLDMDLDGSAADSINAAKRMKDLGVRCIIVLGGDGTTRVVSKGCGDVPLVPLSTGTNNVIPVFIEGVIAGLCSGYVAGLDGSILEHVCTRHKRLEVWVNDELADIALVDIAVNVGSHTGARAVWDTTAVRQIAATRASPANIGLSAVIGMMEPISVDDDYGGLATISVDEKSQKHVLVPLGSSLVESFGIANYNKMEFEKSYPIVDERPLVLALDGEREKVISPGDSTSIILRRNGPLIVDIERAMLRAASSGYFVTQ